jgi:agmatine deiminase
MLATSRRSAGRPAATPAALGYAMPAEWAPHRATWLSWPHDSVTWPGRRMEAARRTFAAMAAALADGERVEILVKNAVLEREARSMLSDVGARASRIRFRRIPTADAWMRDFGPTFLVRRRGRGPKRAYVRWRFNAWGGKYDRLLRDDGLPDRLGLRLPRFAPGIVMEGGSIDADGDGTLLTTEQCLLNRNRNPGLSKQDIERALCDTLGLSKVLWIGEGIAGDDTDGHVDDITRFVAPGVVLTSVEDDPRDENHAPLRENWKRLRTMTDAKRRRLEVVKLPMPSPLYAGRRRLPASYANFYVGNAVVLLPIYGDRTRDAKAIRTLARLFPTRRVVPLECADLVFGYGSIHCVTQQEPA